VNEVTEINGLSEIDPSGTYHQTPIERTLDLSDPELVRIIRIRYIGDSWRGPLDLSYVHGETADGARVRVQGLPYQIRDPRRLRGELYAAADAAGVRLNALCGGHVNNVLSLLV